jgi:hypothetical protein
MVKTDTVLVLAGVGALGLIAYQTLKKGSTLTDSGISSIPSTIGQETGESVSGLLGGLINGLLQGSKDSADKTYNFLQNTFDEWKNNADLKRKQDNQAQIDLIKQMMNEQNIKEIPTDKDISSLKTVKNAIDLVNSYSTVPENQGITSYTEQVLGKSTTIKSPSTSTSSVTVKKATKDASGLTAFDRIIAKNKGLTDKEYVKAYYG